MTVLPPRSQNMKVFVMRAPDGTLVTFNVRDEATAERAYRAWLSVHEKLKLKKRVVK